MGWSNWPRWLRYGIIFAVVNTFLLKFLPFVGELLGGDAPGGGFNGLIVAVIFFVVVVLFLPNMPLYSPLRGLCEGTSSFAVCNSIVSYFSLIVTGFVIGVIVAWIVGKVKSRKQADSLVSQKS